MLEAVLSAPVLIKVLGSLGLILVVNLLRVPFIASVLIGTLALALWCGHAPLAVASIAGKQLFSLEAALLAAVMFLVVWLSSLMEAGGVMRDLVAVLRARLSRRAAIAMLPAVIGFLPMPGGALFSAPLVDRCDPSGNVAPLLKTQINYWFRHIWEYWWPLYPGILLAMKITKLEIWQFMLLGIPLTLASFGAGYFFLLRRMPSEHTDCVEEETHASPLLIALPIIVVVGVYALVRAGYAGLEHVVSGLPPLHNFVPMIIGTLCAMAVQQRLRPLPAAAWKKILFSTKTLSLVVIVLLLHVYGGFINEKLPGGVPLMEVMRGDLARWGIPLIAVMMFIPFISGLTFGVAFGFVGASLPIVVSLLGPDPSVGALLATTVLAYGCGYLGMMLSPVHVCIIVTNEHFGTSLFRSLGGLVRPAAAVFCAVIAVHLMVRWIMGG